MGVAESQMNIFQRLISFTQCVTNNENITTQLEENQ